MTSVFREQVSWGGYENSQGLSIFRLVMSDLFWVGMFPCHSQHIIILCEVSPEVECEGTDCVSSVEETPADQTTSGHLSTGHRPSGGPAVWLRAGRVPSHY